MGDTEITYKIMEKFTSRDRDKGRTYKSGSAKRKSKSESEKKLNELSKITSFLRKENVSEFVKCPLWRKRNHHHRKSC